MGSFGVLCQFPQVGMGSSVKQSKIVVLYSKRGGVVAVCIVSAVEAKATCAVGKRAIFFPLSLMVYSCAMFCRQTGETKVAWGVPLGKMSAA